MLVLSRKRGQVIMIGDNVRVTILDIKPGYTRVGIEAPIETTVHRLEVYEAINEGREENSR